MPATPATIGVIVASRAARMTAAKERAPGALIVSVGELLAERDRASDVTTWIRSWTGYPVLAIIDIEATPVCDARRAALVNLVALRSRFGRRTVAIAQRIASAPPRIIPPVADGRRVRVDLDRKGNSANFSWQCDGRSACASFVVGTDASLAVALHHHLTALVNHSSNSLPAKTRGWLGTITPRIHAKLIRAELLPPREAAGPVNTAGMTPAEKFATLTWPQLAATCGQIIDESNPRVRLAGQSNASTARSVGRGKRTGRSEELTPAGSIERGST